MPIQLSKINTDNLTVKNALEKLGRDSFKLTNPSQGGTLHTTEAPSLSTLDEGSVQFVLTGGTMYLYTKINNTLYRWPLTAV